MQLPAQSIALHVTTDQGAADVQVALSDSDVTVAEVLSALDLSRAGTTIDGIGADPDLKAIHALVPGSRIAGSLTDNHPISDEVLSGGDDQSRPTVEVAVVAGLDAGHLQQLSAGRYRLGEEVSPGVTTTASSTAFSTEVAGEPSWYLAVDPRRDAAASSFEPAAKPWHRGASAIEIVMTDRAALALGDPIDPQAGVVGHVHRPPRRLPPEPVAPAPVDRMPEPVPEPAPLSWAAVLAPIPVALLMAVFFRPFFAVFAAMGPLVAIGRFVETRRRYRRDVRRRDETIASLHVEIAASRAAFARHEAERRWIANPHVAELWRRARMHSRRLWERRPQVTGYLAFTVGIAPAVVSAADVDLDATRGTSATSQIDVLLAEPVVVRSVPHVVDLATERGVGFHGERGACLAMARSAILQLATLHGPADMRVAVLCAAEFAGEWDWLKWLPHVAPELVSSTADGIARSLASRPHDGPSVGGGRDLGEVCLVLVDDPGADTAALTRAAQASALDIRVVAVAAVPTQLPAACTSLVSASPLLAEIVSPQSLGDAVVVCPTGISSDTAMAWARSLAPMVDPECEGFAGGSDGPMGLLQLIDYESAQKLGDRWAARSTDEAPVAVVGTDDRGAAVNLDLDRDGPHMLIAGTTGSGKSELLRTLVVSLASECPPSQLNFVLVDFKGGGAFDACNELPHIAGLITDLDEHLVERAITSLRAELQRREQLFRALGVSDYRAATHQSIDPLPRVMIVVDEFAALASDYPDLMAAIVDLAARGRSLGMHLVLATQRPSGVVDQKIRANTNLRIALRVQDAFDSQDVVGVADAAHIDRASPGRAIVSIGGDRAFAIQSAYAAAPDRRTERCTVAPYTLFGSGCADAAGTRTSRRALPDSERTELEVLVESIGQAASSYRARQLWTDPLPERLAWADLLRKRDSLKRENSDGDTVGGIALGLADTPECQRQQPWYWDPDTGPLVLFGSSARTCSETLMSVAYGFASAVEAEAHLYVIDGDAGTIASLMELPSTGAYVSVHETDRIERTVSYFERALDERRQHPRRSATRLVLLIDNPASVLSRFDDLAASSLIDRLAALCRDGTAQGLHVVIASRTVRDVPHRLAQQFPNRLTAELSDPTAYLTLGLRTRDLAPLPAMRAIDLTTKRVIQLVAPPNADERANLAESAGSAESRWPDDGTSPRCTTPPAAIGSFPAQLSIAEIPAASIEDEVLSLPIGVDAVDLAPAVLRLGPGHHALVAGAPGRGRSQTLLTLVRQIQRGCLELRVLRIAPRGSPLASLSAGGWIATPTSLDEALDAARSQGERVVLVVDDAQQLDAEMVATLTLAVDATRAADEELRLNVIVASTIDHARSLRSWLAPVRAQGRGVLLGASGGDGDLFNVKLGRLDGVGRIAGRGHLVQQGSCVLVQVAALDD